CEAVGNRAATARAIDRGARPRTLIPHQKRRQAEETTMSPTWLRGIALAALLGGVALGTPTGAAAQDLVRLGLPTKTYYPTLIAETALRQGLFAKEGIKAELTIYRSGGETFEASAAGAADLQLNSVPLVAAGRRKGVDNKAVAGAALGYYGWNLMVKTDSKI